MPLDPETVQALLKGEIQKAAYGKSKSATGGANALPRPVQLGPLRWSDTSEPCTSRGCTSPTYISIRGMRKCTNHALHTLNEIILTELEGVNVNECTCKAGVHSKYNIHTFDCGLVKLNQLSSTPELIEELL